MKIVSIFAGKLYAFHYDNEADNELDRLMNLWGDAGYLQSYGKGNKVGDISGFIRNILKDAEEVEDFLENIVRKTEPFGFYFRPLQDADSKKLILSFHKGKIKKNQLRLYAIKIDNNCFVITGGAIKMSQKMEDHPDTAIEVVKLKKAEKYFKQNGIFDEDSFFELLKENI